MSCMIRLAEAAEADMLPQLENLGGQAFLSIPDHAWMADGDDMPVDRHRTHISQGTEWVALSEAGELVGFLAAEIIDRDLHLWELAVRLDAQKQGIGRRLVETADRFARERNLRSLTLTTSADVPWNAPWHSRLGFRMSSDDERLAGLVRAETERGLPARCAMRKAIAFQRPSPPIVVNTGEAPDIDTFLAERIYEYNSRKTGYFDGMSFSATRRDESGAIRAGVSGYTWGGCCYVSYLWVAESERTEGIGNDLLHAVESHAESKGCNVVFLSTHSFQAPLFYERMGYERQAVVQDHPVGYSNIVMAKRLANVAQTNR
jgi:GNAT superfamily N-acetyltransferase